MRNSKDNVKPSMWTSFVPCEVVSDHSSGDGHLLEGKNELTDPDETHSVIPHHVLQRPFHLIFNHACRVVLYWCACEGIRVWVWVGCCTVQSESFYTRPKTFASTVHPSILPWYFLSILPGNKSNKLYLVWLSLVIDVWLTTLSQLHEVKTLNTIPKLAGDQLRCIIFPHFWGEEGRTTQTHLTKLTKRNALGKFHCIIYITIFTGSTLVLISLQLKFINMIFTFPYLTKIHRK